MTSSARTWKSCFLLSVCLWVCSGAGCTLLFPESNVQTKSKSILKPIVSAREAIAIEVYFVDRRIGDPLIGDTLWESLQSVSSIDQKTRAKLDEDGFRVGLSASRPPRPLQTLMSMSNGQDPTRRAVVQPYMIPSGQEAWLVSRGIDDGTEIVRRPLNGEPQTVTISQGQALFKVQASSEEDGWAKLVIIPEIQHGQSSLKPTATASQWTLRDRKQAITLFEDRLSAELNVGEFLVIGMTKDGEGKLASHFFQSDQTNGLQRLMMIRVVDIRTIEPELAD
ncbi:hypothetical protein [Thalassoglobus polymorphus]|uniref:Uncharacterized protein n=1 Tax=Thalassoglobus polymorphus TaxID=2527994 RepID=A0A517QTH6_9PLAN|nr:hypothetical protein [Thalassoglobus polymorphus]QDT34888.1 hypothetical protein Mal48_41610 [Thalassoglobus polymorphus]